MSMQTCEDPLETLIANANITDLKSLNQSVSDAKRLNITLDRALLMSGRTSEQALAMSLTARELVLSGQLSLNAAINALRLANQEHISLDEARQRLKGLHRATRTMVALTNEITNLMLEAGIITREQLGKAMDTATTTGMLTGRVLRLNKHIPSKMLACCLEARIMLREKTQTEEVVIQGLRFAHSKSITLNQALFELGKFKHPESFTLRLADLLFMSGVLTEDEFLECLELSILKKKTINQVVLEQGFLTQVQLDSAEHLLNVVSSEMLLPFEAAQTLRYVTTSGVVVYEAMSRVVVSRPPTTPLLLGSLIVDAGLLAAEKLDAVVRDCQIGNIKIGKQLLDAGLIKESTLFKALRCQSLWRLGYISRKAAVDILKRSELENDPLELTFTKMDIYVPSAMQWSWV
ncbi:MAG: hypothetical protein SGJ27_14405 [Candidatus Melainabacteria bacterium]|nr:hypothetical protein [Candidatus Melainabacteria bacterium]